MGDTSIRPLIFNIEVRGCIAFHMYYSVPHIQDNGGTIFIESATFWTLQTIKTVHLFTP